MFELLTMKSGPRQLSLKTKNTGDPIPLAMVFDHFKAPTGVFLVNLQNK